MAKRNLCRGRRPRRPAVKALQKPDDDRCKKNDRKRLLDKVLCLFPDQLRHTFCRRKTVIRKLHNKRHRFSGILRFTQKQRIENSAKNTKEIQPDHHDRAPEAREKRRRKQRVDRQLRAAAHKRCQKDCHLPVPLAGERSGRHDRRHGASETDQHRHKAPAGETNLS